MSFNSNQFITAKAIAMLRDAHQRAFQIFDRNTSFIAYFSPADRIEKLNAWSVALLFDTPSFIITVKLNKALLAGFKKIIQKAAPAFWPVVTQNNCPCPVLKPNHAFALQIIARQQYFSCYQTSKRFAGANCYIYN